MIDKATAKAATHGTIFYHVTARNADGTALRVRVTGRCKTWKTRPNEFRLPVKYGLYRHLKITEQNASEFLTHDPTEV